MTLHADDAHARFGDAMPILICATLAVYSPLPFSASTKEHRAASVKHEFQLTHPCPATGLTSGTAGTALVFVGLYVGAGLWQRATGRDASALTAPYCGMVRSKKSAEFLGQEWVWA